jgi:hypothetical protein
LKTSMKSEQKTCLLVADSNPWVAYVPKTRQSVLFFEISSHGYIRTNIGNLAIWAGVMDGVLMG